MIEYAEGSTRSLATIQRAVRTGAMPRKILRSLNARRRAMGLVEIAVVDTLADSRARAADAVARMKAAFAGSR